MHINAKNLGFLRSMKNLSDSKFIVDADLTLHHLATTDANLIFGDFHECIMDLQAFDYIRPIVDFNENGIRISQTRFQLTLKALWIIYWSKCREQNRMV